MGQPDDNPVLSIDSFQGGMNSAAPPHLLLQNQCRYANNVDWFQASLMRKRGGGASLGMTGGTAFGAVVSWMSRYVPGADDAAAQLWAADDTPGPIVKYLTGGTAWANATLVDNLTLTKVPLTNGVTLNGKHFVAYDSSVDRMHVVRNDGTLNRMGLAQPTAAPTTGAPFAGAVTDTRTYKVAWVVRVGGVVTRRSELSVASGSVALAAQQVVVTRPAVASEGETDWELYAASTDSIYWRIATTVIGTATATDNNATLPGVTGALAPQIGINTVFPSVKFLSTDGNRLFGAGAWETGRQNSRVWFTPVLGDNDIGDDERMVDSLSRKTYIDLNENDGGYITALSPSLQGAIYAFKYRQVWKLIPTGDFQTPYRPYRISSNIGCISHRSVCAGDDEAGNPCIYFLSCYGPFRVSDAGLEYLGTDLEDVWSGIASASSSLATSQQDFFAIYHTDKNQYWLFRKNVAAYIFSRQYGHRPKPGVVRGGWSVYANNGTHSGFADAYCACMFAKTVGASMSYDLKPFIGFGGSGGAGNVIGIYDTTDTTDIGGAFASWARSGVYSLGGEGQTFMGMEPVVTGYSASPVTLTVTIESEGLLQSKQGTWSPYNALASETTPVVVEGCRLAGCKHAYWEIGDTPIPGAAGAWKLDKISIPYSVDQQLP